MISLHSIRQTYNFPTLDPTNVQAVVAFVLIDTVVLCGLPGSRGPFDTAEAAEQWRWLEVRSPPQIPPL